MPPAKTSPVGPTVPRMVQMGSTRLLASRLASRVLPRNLVCCLAVHYNVFPYPCPRIVFPTVAQNVAPISILPQFLEVLGRKVDSCEDVLDSRWHLYNTGLHTPVLKLG